MKDKKREQGRLRAAKSRERDIAKGRTVRLHDALEPKERDILKGNLKDMRIKQGE